MTSSVPAEFNQGQLRRRRRPGPGAAAAIAALGLLGWADGASASLLGAKVSYRSLFPTTNSVLNNLGTKTVAALTVFDDTKNGIRSFFIGSQLVVENTSPLAFAGGAFNGPQFTFSAGGLTGATIDPASSADFKGVLSSTGNGVQTSFSALTPALGSTLTVDLASGAPLAGQQVGYKYFVPTAASLQEDLGTRTLATGTFFIDVADGITVAIDANTITIINDSPLAFANGAFNGPDLVFSGVDILAAAIDPVSAADFKGALSFTPNSIAVNFANFLPQAGHALVIDVTAIPEPGALALLVLPLAGLAWVGSCRRTGAIAAPAPSRPSRA